MDDSVKDIIRRRKSVCTFNGVTLRKEDRQKLERYLETLDNPFDVQCKKTKSMSDNSLGDIRKVDVGIALAHFDLTLKESGTDGCFMAGDPGFKMDDLMEYINIYEVKH